MEIKVSSAINDEQNILRTFFETISAENQHDNTISDSKIIRDTQKKLKISLRNSEHKCTCNKCRYTICEVCQGSERELVELRNFFRMIQKAKQNNLSTTDIQEFIENTKKHLRS
jgi:DNA-directed RNA polymerase alpha subunit